MLYKRISIPLKRLLSFIYCFLLVSNSYATKLLTIPLHNGHIIESSKSINTAFIADPNIADYHIKSTKQVYLYAKKIGSTSFHTLDEQGNILQDYKIEVTQDLSSLQQALHSLFPSAQVKMVTIGEKAVAIKGSVDSPSEAEDIRNTVAKFLPDPANVINLLRVNSATQINLRVEVIELDRGVERSLGLDWLLNYKTSRSTAQIHTQLIPSAFSSTPLDSIDFSGLITPGNFTLSALLRFLEKNQLATILSEPNLTAQSGASASFLVGGEFPVLLPSGSAQTPGVVYKDYGVSLTFAPTVLANNRMNIQIKSEVSQITTQSDQGSVKIQGYDIPALIVRRAETTVELNSGQSFAIAGLLQNNADKLFAQLPGIGNVPILGALFRSQQFQRNETELVIIVTPYLVSPNSPTQMANPLRGLDTESPANRAATIRHATGADKNIGFILKG